MGRWMARLMGDRYEVDEVKGRSMVKQLLRSMKVDEEVGADR